VCACGRCRKKVAGHFIRVTLCKPFMYFADRKNRCTVSFPSPGILLVSAEFMNFAHSPPYGAEVNEWCHTFLPPVYLHVVDRGEFTFYIQVGRFSPFLQATQALRLSRGIALIFSRTFGTRLEWGG